MVTTSRPLTLVTGAARGIGAEIAVRLAADGHDLALTYRVRHDEAEQVAARCRTLGAEVDLFRLDLGDLDAVAALGPEVVLRCGRWDNLVNNAATIGRIGPFDEVPVSEVQRLLAINATAPFVLTQAAVRHFAHRHGGRGGAVVNVSSTAVDTGGAHTYVHYAMSKAALSCLTTGVAQEYAREGIRVNTVTPGTTVTEIHAEAGRPDAPAERAAGLPFGRAARAEEIAGAVAFLLSPGAGYVSNAEIRVAGAK